MNFWNLFSFYVQLWKFFCFHIFFCVFLKAKSKKTTSFWCNFMFSFGAFHDFNVWKDFVKGKPNDWDLTKSALNFSFKKIIKKFIHFSSHYLTWSTHAFILTFLHHSTRILMLLMQLIKINAVELPSNWHLKRNLSRWNSKRSMSSPVVHCDHCPLPRPQPSYCLAPVKFVLTPEW